MSVLAGYIAYRRERDVSSVRWQRKESRNVCDEGEREERRSGGVGGRGGGGCGWK